MPLGTFLCPKCKRQQVETTAVVFDAAKPGAVGLQLQDNTPRNKIVSGVCIICGIVSVTSKS